MAFLRSLTTGSLEEMLSPEEREAERTALWKRTADAVKAVQSQFATKKELATCDNSSISCLCAQFETVFCHGLRAARRKGAEVAFWPCVKELLSGSDVEMISGLQHITTDSGRGRAWIRSALNERSLEKQLHQLAANPTVVRNFYDDWAFLLDEERVNMLAMLAVGLESTLFAIDIDSASLDTVRTATGAVASSGAASGTSGGVPANVRPISIHSERGSPPAAQDADTPVAEFVPMHEHEAHGQKLEVVEKKKKKKKKKRRSVEIGASGSGNPTSSSGSSKKTHRRGASNASISSDHDDRTAAGQPVQQPAASPSSVDDVLSAASALLAATDPRNAPAPASPPAAAVTAATSSTSSTGSAAYDLGSPTPAMAAVAEVADVPDSRPALDVDTLELPAGFGHPTGGGGPNAPPNSAELASPTAGPTAEVPTPAKEAAPQDFGATLASYFAQNTISDEVPRRHNGGDLGGSGGPDPSPPARVEAPPPTAEVRAAPAPQPAPVARSVQRQDDAATDDGMSTDELRQVLLGAMRAKDEFEAENRTLQEALAAAASEIAALKAEQTALAFAHAETKQRFENATRDQEAKTVTVSKENALLKQQLKKYVSEAQQLKAQNRALQEQAAAGPTTTPASSPAHSAQPTPADSPVKQEAAAPAPSTPEGQLEPGAVEEDDGDRDALVIGDAVDDSFQGYQSVDDMQAHHERQILTLTQMHCELLELNDRLQQQLRDRDLQVVQLGGKVPSDSGRPSLHPAPKVARPARLAAPSTDIRIPGTNKAVNVWIPAAFTRGDGPDSYHVYQIYVRVQGEEWNVYRRYTHFHDLHRQVHHIFPDEQLSLPAKKIFARKGSKFVEERRKGLEQYIRKVVQLCLSQPRSPIIASPCKATLCEALPFLREKMSATAAQQERQRSNSASYKGL